MEPALDGLIDALRRLPGVGVKSAQRMAYHLLQHDREGARRLAGALTDALQRMRHCDRCHTYTQAEVCSTCSDPRRDGRLGSHRARRPAVSRSTMSTWHASVVGSFPRVVPGPPTSPRQSVFAP